MIYADQSQADEAHLVVFDRHSRRSWSQRIYRRQESYQGRTITVWGC